MVDLIKMEEEFIAKRKAFNLELRLAQNGFKKVSLWVRSINAYEHLKGFTILSTDDDGYYISYYEKCEPFRLKEKLLDENPLLISFTYKNGSGGMVIDQESFNALPKGTQNKIINLFK